MWTRLHGPSENGESARVVVADVTPERAKQEAEEAARGASSSVRMVLSTVAPLVHSANTNTVTAPSGLLKRHLQPPEVSNNNTDDEGGPSVPLRNGVGGVLDISLSLENVNGHGSSDSNSNIKRRKLSTDDGDKGSGCGNNKKNNNDGDESKNLRISPVAV